MIGDDRTLAASLEALDALVPGRVDMDDLLGQVVRAVEVLFNLDGAGVMLVDDSQVLRSVLVTDERGAALERSQERAATGPCVEAFVYDHPIRCGDIHSDERYAKVSELLGDNPIRAVLGVPLRLVGTPVGVLNLYVDEPHPWDDAEVDSLCAYSEVLTRLLSAGLAARRNDERARQLQHALDHRVVIERAVGYLMASSRVDARTAFQRLRRSARDSRCKVSDVAAAILDGAG